MEKLNETICSYIKNNNIKSKYDSMLLPLVINVSYDIDGIFILNNSLIDRILNNDDTSDYNKELVEFIRNNINNLDEELFKNMILFDLENFCCDYMTSEFKHLKYMPAGLKSDKELFLKLVSIATRTISFASEALKNDDDIFLEACVNPDPDNIYDYFPKKTLDNKDFVLKIFSSYYIYDKYKIYDVMSKKLKEDEDIYYLANCPLEYFNRKFSNNKKIIKKMLSYDWKNIKYAGSDILNDKEFMIDLIKRKGSLIKYASYDLRNDREIAIISLKKSKSNYKYLSYELQCDEEIIKLSKITKVNKETSDDDNGQLSLF